MGKALTGSLLVCVAAAGVAVGALALDAGGDEEGGDGDDAAQPLVIDDFAFSANTAAPGQTVTVSNQDDAPHTVTANDGSFTTDTIDPGGSSSFVAPTAPGSYQIRCTIHPEMSGTLAVQGTPPPDQGTPPADQGTPAPAPSPSEPTTGDTEYSPGY
jgi:plastocyanin